MLLFRISAGETLKDELTLKEVKDIIDQLVNMKVFNICFLDWLTETIPQPNEFLRNFFNFSIFSDLDFNYQALKSANKMMEFSRRSNNTEGLAKSYNCIGLLHTRLNNYKKGLEYYHLVSI